MIRFEIRGIRFCVPLLTLLGPLLAVRLGMQADFFPMLIALGVHETAHMIAACVTRVNITEIRILPFGGSMRMENPYHIKPSKLIFIAFAGPIANFLMILLFSAAAHWNLLDPVRTKALFSPNIILCLFNLIPALPLDGGRITVALLTKLISEEKALRTGIICGRVLAFALVCVMFAGGMKSGVWNISFLFAAIFIIASEKDERRALSSSRMIRIHEALDGFDMQQAHIYQIDGAHSAAQALQLMKPRENAWFIITKNGCPHSILDSRSLIKHVMDHPAIDPSLISLPGFILCASNNKDIIFRQEYRQSR